MIRQNLHTHTIFDDGKNTPAEMAEAALRAGFSSLGFSGHSTLPWENEWSLTAENIPAYLAAVEKTRRAFSGRLTIFSGLEWDNLSDQDVTGFDYIIGSIHQLSLDGAHPSVDEAPEVTAEILARYFAGDAAALAEAYYAQYEAVADADFVDIVGHFDLITKFDEVRSFFDETDPRYRDAAMAAMERLLRADKLFEVNTGAISRGWRKTPYPSPALLKELRLRGARLVVSSDAHSAGAVDCAFSETEELLRSLGFRERWELTDRGFVPTSL